MDSDNSLFSVTSFDSDVADDFNRIHGYDCCKGQRTTAITKLQVMLNEVINNHKASLKMHDDIVHLFNEYISSPSFDKYATLKQRTHSFNQWRNPFMSPISDQDTPTLKCMMVQ